MLTGYVSFSAKVSGGNKIECTEPIEITGLHDAVEKIIVDLQKNERVGIQVWLREVETEQDAGTIANQVARQIVSRLVMRYSLKVGDPCVGSSNLKDVNTPPNVVVAPVVVAHAIVLSPTVEITKRLGGEELAKLTDYLQESSLPGEQSYELFRYVGQTADPSTEFMLLYALLWAAIGIHKKQVAVDDFIRKHQKGVEERLSPWTQKNETIYSWLRNEVGHINRSPGVTPAIIAEGMAKHLPGLREHVQRAIQMP